MPKLQKVSAWKRLKLTLNIVYLRARNFSYEKCSDIKNVALDGILVFSVLGAFANSVRIDVRRLLEGGWQQLAGILGIVFVLAVRLIKNRKMVGNAILRSDADLTPQMNTKVSLVQPSTEQALEIIDAHLAIFGSHLTSRPNDMRRRKMQDWFSEYPSLWAGVYEEDQLVAYSIFLPLTKQAWLDYRNGTGSPFEYSKKSFSLPGDPETVLYDFVTFVKPGFAGKIPFVSLFTSHLGQVLALYQNSFLVVSPAISAETIQNREVMGFSFVGYSSKRFRIYELDFRRPDELRPVARMIVEATRKRARALKPKFRWWFRKS